MKRGDIVRIINVDQMEPEQFIGNNDEFDPALKRNIERHCRIRVGFRISDIEGKKADIQTFVRNGWVHAYALPLKFLQLVSKG